MIDTGFYDPTGFELYVAILYQIKGFSSGSMVGIKKVEDLYKPSTGSSGTTERLATASNDYTIDISLAQTSPSNSILTTLMNLDRTTHRAIFPIFIKDKSSGSTFVSESSFILKAPDVDYTGEIETRLWSFYCSNVSYALSGNQEKDISSNVSSLISLASTFKAYTGGIL